MKQYEAFIFDMDGTMVDNMAYHVQAWLALLAELGVPLTESEFHRRLSGKTNEETVREMLGAETPAAEIERLAQQKEAHYRALFGPHLRPVAGLPQFVARAREMGIKTAVATSADLENIAFILGGLGLQASFTAVVGAHTVAKGKPHPDIFLAAAAQLQVAPSTCLVFEDSRAGIESARRAGMDTIVITTNLTEQEAGAFPNVIHSIADFQAATLDQLTG